MSTWDEYFIRIAMEVAKKSKDDSTKVGCVIVGEHHNVLSTGFNGFPRGVDEDLLLRWVRPTKYLFVEHAERNALYNAARHGVRLEGATAYLNWEACPCTDCARGFIQSGIRAVVGPSIPFPGKGVGVSYEVGGASLEMLAEAGVELRSISWPVGG